MTGDQWFHPKFPFKKLFEGEFGYSNLNISFTNFETPKQPSLRSFIDLEPPLFDPPPGNYYDESPPIRPVYFDQTRYIRLIINNDSNIDLDAVMRRLRFSHSEVLKIIFSINSGSRLFVSTKYAPGLPVRGRIWGGAAQYDNGTAGPGVVEAGINLVFEFNSWKPSFGWEIPQVVKSVSQWFGSVCPSKSDGLYVKVPRTFIPSPEQTLHLPRKGWRDSIANIFSPTTGDIALWDEWDVTVCGKGRLCTHQYDIMSLVGFDDHEQALLFRELRSTNLVRKQKMLLMLHPLRWQWLFDTGASNMETLRTPKDPTGKGDMYVGREPIGVGVKGFDVSGGTVVDAPACTCPEKGAIGRAVYLD